MRNEDIILATLNLSTLKIGGRVYGQSEVQSVKLRYHEIVGMIELARRLDAVDNDLLDALEAHREELRRQLAKLEAG